MPVLSLHDASILYVNGFGGDPGIGANCRAEFSDDATLSVYKNNFLGGETKALSISLGMLSLRVWSDSMQTGGGFVGGGFGLAGAAEGMLTAAVLNALTTKRREYALLGVSAFLDDGSQRDLVLGFRYISESVLRQRLARALPVWTDCYVNLWLNVLHTNHITEQDAEASYLQLKQAAERDLLSRDQIRRMWSALALIVPPPKRNIALPADDRVATLKTLAELRASGALTQNEFEAEKARILSGN